MVKASRCHPDLDGGDVADDANDLNGQDATGDHAEDARRRRRGDGRGWSSRTLVRMYNHLTEIQAFWVPKSVVLGDAQPMDVGRAESDCRSG